MGFHQVAGAARDIAAAHRFHTQDCGCCISACTMDPGGIFPAPDVVPA